MNALEILSHEAAIELLPWIVNDSLAEDEKAAVLEHAHACVICRRELGELERLRDSISQSSAALPTPPPDMRNINARIDELVNRGSWGRSLLSRIRDAIERSSMIAFATPSILLLVLAGFLLWPNPENREFTTLTQADDLPDGQYVRMVFSPEMADSEFSTLLDTFELRVVDGPSRRGVYTLGLAESLSAEDRDELVSRLQQDHRVLFAQPVTGGSGP